MSRPPTPGGKSLAYLGLDGQVEGTFFKGQQVPIVVACTFWVDPHFDLPVERRKVPGLLLLCLATPESSAALL